MRYYTLLICVLFGFEGEALMCIRCDSQNPHGLCRRGNRKHHTKHYTESCYGKNYGKNSPKCYTAALVNDFGEMYFERGCTLDSEICSSEYDDVYLNYCQTCTRSYCNNDEVKLEQEVEGYPIEEGDRNESIRSEANVSSSVIEYGGNDVENLQVLTFTTASDDSATKAAMTAQLLTNDTDFGGEGVPADMGRGFETILMDDGIMSGNTTENSVNSTNNVEDPIIEYL